MHTCTRSHTHRHTHTHTHTHTQTLAPGTHQTREVSRGRSKPPHSKPRPALSYTSSSLPFRRTSCASLRRANSACRHEHRCRVPRSQSLRVWWNQTRMRLTTTRPVAVQPTAMVAPVHWRRQQQPRLQRQQVAVPLWAAMEAVVVALAVAVAVQAVVVVVVVVVGLRVSSRPLQVASTRGSRRSLEFSPATSTLQTLIFLLGTHKPSTNEFFSACDCTCDSTAPPPPSTKFHDHAALGAALRLCRSYS
jgi:hypothetical protein